MPKVINKCDFGVFEISRQRIYCALDGEACEFWTGTSNRQAKCMAFVLMPAAAVV